MSAETRKAACGDVGYRFVLLHEMLAKYGVSNSAIAALVEASFIAEERAMFVKCKHESIWTTAEGRQCRECFTSWSNGEEM